MLRDMKVDITPTINDVRPPYINLANKSLPMASVPRICERVGAELNAAGSDVYGSKFKIKGKIITKNDRSKKNINPAIANLLFNNFSTTSLK